jgi:hypothetical protein
MKTETSIDAIEKDGKDCFGVEGPTLIVRSHWSIDDWCVVIIGGKSLTVNRQSLISAIQKSGCKS